MSMRLTKNAYIFGASALVGVLGVVFLVRRARAKEREAALPPSPPQPQMPFRAPGSTPTLDVRKPKIDRGMPRPPQRRKKPGAVKAFEKEFQKFQRIQAMPPHERAKARRAQLEAQGIKPGSTVPGPANLPPPWACPQGYGWVHNGKKFPDGRWSCKQGVVTQRPGAKKAKATA